MFCVLFLKLKSQFQVFQSLSQGANVIVEPDCLDLKIFLGSKKRHFSSRRNVSAVPYLTELSSFPPLCAWSSCWRCPTSWRGTLQSPPWELHTPANTICTAVTIVSSHLHQRFGLLILLLALLIIDYVNLAIQTVYKLILLFSFTFSESLRTWIIMKILDTK